MASHIQCQCGKLAKYAADPGVPYHYDAGTDTYSLELSDKVVVADTYCHLCGGLAFKNGAPDFRGAQRCKCGFLDHCHKQGSPIELDNMFKLRCTFQGEEHWLALWFCPSCGGLA